MWTISSILLIGVHTVDDQGILTELEALLIDHVLKQSSFLLMSSEDSEDVLMVGQARFYLYLLQSLEVHF